MPTTTGHQQTNAPAASHAAPAAVRPVLPPVSAEAPDVEMLQDAIGNRAVGSLIEGGALIQRKCSGCASSGTTCSGCADEEQVRRAAGPGAPAPSTLPPAVTSALAESGGRGLDASTRTFMESRFGRSFGGVRVHTGQSAARAADAIGASAFTVGNAIWFGRGQYDPSSGEGLHLLAHELTHTIQQRGHAAGAQASLSVGSVSDPAEFAADRAADAVLAARPVARIGASRTFIRRKPKVSPVAGDPSRRIVLLDDGTKYRVTRHVEWTPHTETRPANELKFGAKISKDRVWLQVDWCKETNKGDVKVGANVPAASKALLEELILKGTAPLEALKKAEVEPFLAVVVAESRKYKLETEATVKVTPGEGEVTGGGIKGRLKLPGEIDITAEGSINKPPEGSGREGPDWKVIFGVEHRFGKGPEAVKCKTVRREEWEPTVWFTCEKFEPAHEEERKRPITRTKSVYLYFRYAKAVFEERPAQPGGKLNPASMAELRKDLADRWKVTAITGHASPEGPMDPTKRFQGNRALSQERADVAKTWLESACPPPSLLVMRPEEAGCFAPGLKPTGQGELHSGDFVPEKKGKALADVAVPSFEGDPKEARHRTPELEKELEKRKGSTERQTDVIYPLMRRAEIYLAKPDVETYKVQVEDRWNPDPACPKDALEAGADDFAKGPALKPPVAK